VADAEFRYADLLPAGADDTPYRLDLVAQGAQDPAVRLWVRLLVAGFGGIEDAEDALPESQAPGYAGELGDVIGEHEVSPSPRGEPVEGGEDVREHPPLRGIHEVLAHAGEQLAREPGRDARRHVRPLQDRG
jgi:hypothetical protein